MIDYAGRSEWRSGWPLVATSCVGMMVSVIHIYSMGIFIVPMQTELGWSRTTISGGLVLSAALNVVCAPFVGGLIDRYGARWIGIFGAAFYSASFSLLAVVNSSPAIWLGMWCFVAFGALFLKPTVWTAAVASRFEKSRGLAFALTLSGTGLAAAILPYLAHSSIEWIGWRATFGLIGALSAAILLPLMWKFFKAADHSSAAKSSPTDASGGSIWAVYKSRRFIQLAFATLLVTTCITMIVVNFVPIMRSVGIAAGNAAAIASVVGISSIIGRLAGGLLVDRIDARWVAAIAFLLPTAACGALLIAVGDSGILGGGMAIAIAVKVGLSIGAEIEVIAYLTTRYFGLAKFGAVFGMIVTFLSMGGGLGPLVGSAVFDETGSYRLAVMGAVPIFIVATILIVSLGKYPDTEAQAG